MKVIKYIKEREIPIEDFDPIFKALLINTTNSDNPIYVLEDDKKIFLKGKVVRY